MPTDHNSTTTDMRTDVAGALPALLSLDEQVARLTPGHDDKYFVLGTLPTGETVERGIGDGVLNDWIRVTRGDVEMQIRAGGAICDLLLAGRLIDEVSLEELDDLRALLTLDRAQLGAVADLGPELTEAIEVWYDLPHDEAKRLHKHVGFAAWLNDPNRPRECRPVAETPPIVKVPTPDEYAVQEAARRAEWDAMWKRPRAEWSMERRAAALAVDITKLLNGRYDKGLDAERAARLAGLLESFTELDRPRQIAVIDAWIDAPAVATALAGNVPAISIETLYHDPDQGGDLCNEPRGPLAYIGYVCGEGDSRVEVSFSVEGTSAPEVYMFRRDGVPLDVVERTLDQVEQAYGNVRVLLNDPRVKAARVRYEAGASVGQKTV